MAHLAAFDVRGTYQHLRRSGETTLVGAIAMHRKTTDRNLLGFLNECQRIIDEAHREWSGVDARDPRVIFLRDLELRKTSLRIGPNLKIDLRVIEHDWIFQTYDTWAKAGPRGPKELPDVAIAWKILDEVLAARGVSKRELGPSDMTAVVKEIRKRWPLEKTQTRRFSAIEKVMRFARLEKRLEDIWGDVPTGFAIDRSKHLPSGVKGRNSSNDDEAFRFVPQPIVDWVMDHLSLINRGDPYLTAEARALIYIHERCGRRTGETIGLEDDCISYDAQGAPYLMWTQGKPPYTDGKRLPIHQETHDVIREWQAIKRDKGVKSKWLFPSRRYSKADKTHTPYYLAVRLRELLKLITVHAPYDSPVVGSEGNLIHFDLSTIDPYSFRHAFAQRYADATDEAGRPTTPPDVLQELMGHMSFNTTMGYYQVTVKRRRKAVDALPARRLSVTGEIVDVDRERDAFGKVAVSLGHCSEPQNVAANGHFCALEHACESCPFFLVDPLERDGMAAKRLHLRVKFERASVIQSPQHILDHYAARIQDYTSIIDGIDGYIEGLPEDERKRILTALDDMADVRKRAGASRTIDLREFFRREDSDVA
ncbi:tyrosine-type recombinase/integrase [Arthrobacter sp. SO3]|uniref:tyrosine-type recombinase/integrase n=1 Tax=Arthrobacter sp. SO3 TaxID=1897057 RepID=UPI001CFF84FB|nr:site-specific integrase [Arthrobacter sp. SO3]